MYIYINIDIEQDIALSIPISILISIYLKISIYIQTFLFIIIAPIFLLIPQERKIKTFRHTGTDMPLPPSFPSPTLILCGVVDSRNKKKKNQLDIAEFFFGGGGGHSDKKRKKNKTPTHYFIQKGIQAIYFSNNSKTTPPSPNIHF